MIRKTFLCLGALALVCAGTVFASGNTVKQKKQSEADIVAQQAFSKLVHKYFPMSPEQIHQFKNIAAEQAKANATPPGVAPPQGTSNTIMVSLKPGATQPIIRIGQGTITSLIFVDANGKVWPITSYSVGNPKAFNIQWDKKSGVLMIQGQNLFVQSNIGVMLKGMQIPVMMTLLVGQKQWDYMDYIRVPAYIPNGAQSVKGAPKTPDYLISLLSGVPPKGSVQKETSGGTAQIWSYKGKYLLLTPGTLLSPAWSARAVGTGPNPTIAYELKPAPYILISVNGVTQKVLVSGGASQ